MADNYTPTVISNVIGNRCRTSKHELNLEMVWRSLDYIEIDADELYYQTTQIVGSSAEIYIKPHLSCVGDLDIMVCQNEIVAYENNRKRTEEDSERTENELRYHYRLKNLEICYIEPDENYHGYVSLKRRRKQKLQLGGWDIEVDLSPELLNIEHIFAGLEPNYRKNAYFTNTYRKVGPTWPSQFFNKKVEIVLCIKCVEWPTVADEWFHRAKNGNLSEGVINHVYNTIGCDLVPVAHDDCQSNEYQWRYSFSKAEVYLLNHWTREQQIIYHMLRYFLKKEFKDVCSSGQNKVFSMYLIKTLMMWECENKPLEWWTSDCLIVICHKLLETFVDWISKEHFPNYFICKSNLISNRNHPYHIRYDPYQKEAKRWRN